MQKKERDLCRPLCTRAACGGNAGGNLCDATRGRLAPVVKSQPPPPSPLSVGSPLLRTPGALRCSARRAPWPCVRAAGCGGHPGGLRLRGDRSSVAGAWCRAPCGLHTLVGGGGQAEFAVTLMCHLDSETSFGLVWYPIVPSDRVCGTNKIKTCGSPLYNPAGAGSAGKARGIVVGEWLGLISRRQWPYWRGFGADWSLRGESGNDQTEGKERKKERYFCFRLRFLRFDAQ